MPLNKVLLLPSVILLTVCPVIVSTYSNYNSGLTEVPGDIPLSADVIIIIGNELVTLPSRAFSAFTQLYDLQLDNNKLTTIASDAFDDTEIVYLGLSRNELTAAMVPSLAGIGATLSVLWLDLNPALALDMSDDWPGVEVGLTSLTGLALANTGLSGVPSLTGPAATLEGLDIWDNNITVFPREYVSGPYELSALTYLDIENNKLSSFPDSRGLPLLDTLFLGGNPVVCDSRLAWMKNSPGIYISLDAMPCTEPLALNGVLWNNINPTDMPLYQGKANVCIIIKIYMMPWNCGPHIDQK